MIPNQKTVEWLLQYAGSVIRYRTAREILNEKGENLEKLRIDLMSNLEVQIWLNNLKIEKPLKRNAIHGSLDNQFENAMLKVIQLGLHAGIPELDEIVEPFIEYLENESNKGDGKRKLFNSIIIASILLKAGYRTTPIIEFMKGSLHVMSSFAIQKSYDIYVANRNEYKGIPKNWSNTPIIKPEIIEKNGFCYPMIYDLVGLSKMCLLEDNEVNKQVHSVIQYILTDDFHENIIDGYGILFSGPGKYYSMGWDPKLPGYYDVSDSAKENPHKLLFVADIMSDYPVVVKSSWYIKVIHYLEQFKTNSDDCTYCFPKEYLREKSGYGVQGFHLGLGENRRNKKWAEIESTFVMMRLKREMQ